jgi:hypothetical protein
MHLIVSVGNSVQLNWFLRVLPKFCSTTKRNPPLNDDEIYIFLNAAYKNFNQFFLTYFLLSFYYLIFIEEALIILIFILEYKLFYNNTLIILLNLN